MKVERDDSNDSAVTLDTYNSDLNLVIEPSLYAAQPLTNEGFAFMWAGARATHGVNKGKICYEVLVVKNLDVPHLPSDEPNPHVVRVGFSVESSTLQLGEDPLSYGYGGTGKISTNCQFKDYGSSFGENDCIMAFLNMDSDPVEIGFAKNGVFIGWAYRVNKSQLGNKALYPHILTKNVSFEVNFGQKDTPYGKFPDGFSNYTFITRIPPNQRERGTKAPERREDCEMIMMCGLPGAGKSVWATEYSAKHMDKKYNVLGTNNIIDKMKVMGLPRKRNYHGRWDVLIQMATKCLNKMFDIGSKLRRNYILDQTNVYPTAQRRKMRNFEGFQRKAVVVVPTEEEFKRRCNKRDREEGKEIPDHAVLEMKANFKLPEVNDIFDEVIFTELQRQDAEKLVRQYNEEGKSAVGTAKRFRPNEPSPAGRGSRGSGDYGGARGYRAGGRGGHGDGGFGRGGQDSGWYGRGGQDSASYGRGGQDSGSFNRGQDSGSFNRGGQDRGSFGRGGQDSGSFGRGGQDSGSFGRGGQDSGSFGRGGQDSGSFGRGDQDSGSFGRERGGQERGGNSRGSFSRGGNGGGSFGRGHNSGSFGRGGHSGGSFGRGSHDSGSFGRGGSHDSGTFGRGGSHDSGSYSRGSYGSESTYGSGYGSGSPGYGDQSTGSYGRGGSQGSFRGGRTQSGYGRDGYTESGYGQESGFADDQKGYQSGGSSFGNYGDNQNKGGGYGGRDSESSRGSSRGSSSRGYSGAQNSRGGRSARGSDKDWSDTRSSQQSGGSGNQGGYGGYGSSKSENNTGSGYGSYNQNYGTYEQPSQSYQSTQPYSYQPQQSQARQNAPATGQSWQSMNTTPGRAQQAQPAAPPAQQHWSSYYPQQSQQPYYNQYYGQQSASAGSTTPPVYGTGAYTAK